MIVRVWPLLCVISEVRTLALAEESLAARRAELNSQIAGDVAELRTREATAELALIERMLEANEMHFIEPPPAPPMGGLDITRAY